MIKQLDLDDMKDVNDICRSLNNPIISGVLFSIHNNVFNAISNPVWNCTRKSVMYSIDISVEDAIKPNYE